MGDRIVLYMEEGLTLGPVSPAGLFRGFVPDIISFDDVVIFLVIIRGIVADLPKVSRKHFNSFRHWDHLNFPMIM